MKTTKTLKLLNLTLLLTGLSLIVYAWFNVLTVGLSKTTSNLTIEAVTSSPVENNQKYSTIVNSKDGTLILESSSPTPLEENITLHKIKKGEEFQTQGTYTINQGWIYSTEPVTVFSGKTSPQLPWLLLGSGLTITLALLVQGVGNALTVSNHPQRHNRPYQKNEHQGETGESLMLSTLIIFSIFNLNTSLLITFNQNHGWDFYQILAAVGITLVATLICFMIVPILIAVPAVKTALKISYPSIGNIPVSKLKQGIKTEEEIKQWLENKKWNSEIGETLIENFEGDMRKLVKVTKELAK